MLRCAERRDSGRLYPRADTVSGTKIIIVWCWVLYALVQIANLNFFAKTEQAFEQTWQNDRAWAQTINVVGFGKT